MSNFYNPSYRFKPKKKRKPFTVDAYNKRLNELRQQDVGSSGYLPDIEEAGRRIELMDEFGPPVEDPVNELFQKTNEILGIGSIRGRNGIQSGIDKAREILFPDQKVAIIEVEGDEEAYEKMKTYGRKSKRFRKLHRILDRSGNTYTIVVDSSVEEPWFDESTRMRRDWHRSVPNVKSSPAFSWRMLWADTITPSKAPGSNCLVTTR